MRHKHSVEIDHMSVYEAATRQGLWVVVPAYNEDTVIASTLDEMLPFAGVVVVVDDGSDDRTREVAHRHGAIVLRHAVNLGQGAALQTGITYALRAGATHVATFDADGQHDPRTLMQMLDLLTSRDLDVVLASRFLGSTVSMPPPKRIALQLALAFTKLQTRLALTDTHNGLRMFTAAAARRMRLHQAGMAHASEILSEIARLELRYAEIASTLTYTEYSKNKGQPISNAVRIAFDIFYQAWSR